MTTYTLNVTAINGSVTKNPSKGTYSLGDSVILTAVPNSGFTFTGWSGDLSGGTNPVTIVMNGDKSINASFDFDTNVYTLGITAAGGSVSRSPDKNGYMPGDVVTLQATANTGYAFSGWSGDLSGSSNSATLVMNSNKAVTANFVANTPTLFALSIAATGGTVVKNPDKSGYNAGDTVTLQAIPSTGQQFVSWTGAVSGASNPATLVMDSDKAVTASFQAVAADTKAPAVSNCQPEPSAIQAPLNTLVTLHVADDGRGVDANTVTISLGGTLVYTGNVPSYPRRTAPVGAPAPRRTTRLRTRPTRSLISTRPWR